MELPTLSLTGMNEAFLSNRLFEGLTPEVLRSVDIQEVEYRPGDLIFDEGTAGSTLMLAPGWTVTSRFCSSDLLIGRLTFFAATGGPRISSIDGITHHLGKK